MEVISAPIESLIPYARNARTHSDAQIAQIAASIQEFGWTNPILVDGSNGIIAGHGRVLAARKLGLSEVPVIELSHLTEAQKRAYIIADNKLALNAGWDDELLKVEFEELKLEDFDLELTGFTLDEIAALAPEEIPAGKTDEDYVPEVQPEPISKLGDVWICGKHRVMCGDCTDALVVEKVLNGVLPHLMVTDPPYGVEYDADWRNKAIRSDGTPFGGRAIGKVSNDSRSDWRDAWALFPGDVAYVWHADRHASEVQESLEASKFTIRCQIIWAKTRFAIGRGDYHWQHEPCWYAVRNGRTGHWAVGRDQSTLWTISHSKSETGHSTQKPVECMRRPIENNSSPGQAIYEPFSGSGTTIIAAEMTGRCAYAIEVDPRYVDVSVRRWQEFTGNEAVLESDGRTFAEVSNGREAA